MSELADVVEDYVAAGDRLLQAERNLSDAQNVRDRLVKDLEMLRRQNWQVGRNVRESFYQAKDGRIVIATYKDGNDVMPASVDVRVVSPEVPR